MDERTWEEMSVGRVRAAKALLDLGFYRDSISRFYYAAYCAATGAVAGRNITFAFGRQNPSYEQLPRLILSKGHISITKRRRIGSLLRVLRNARVDVDYRPRYVINRSDALDSIRDASAVLQLLES